MPWKERYTISDERTLPDSEVRWPDGKRCCFRIVVDLAPASGPDGIKPTDLTTPDAYFGMHGGLRAVCDLLKRRGLKATFAVPAVMAEIHGDTIRRLRDEGHEIAAHGFDRGRLDCRFVALHAANRLSSPLVDGLGTRTVRAAT